MIKHKSQKHGFSLIETLLSLAVIGLIAGLSAPLYQSFHTRSQLRVAENTIAQTLRQAQSYAQAVKGDSRWGVYVQPGTVTLFRGDRYDSRDTSFDIDFDIRDSLDISGDQEYVFRRVSGRVEQPGEINLSTRQTEQRTVSVNELGAVSYSPL